MRFIHWFYERYGTNLIISIYLKCFMRSEKKKMVEIVWSRIRIGDSCKFKN